MFAYPYIYTKMNCMNFTNFSTAYPVLKVTVRHWHTYIYKHMQTIITQTARDCGAGIYFLLLFIFLQGFRLIMLSQVNLALREQKSRDLSSIPEETKSEVLQAMDGVDNQSTSLICSLISSLRKHVFSSFSHKFQCLKRKRSLPLRITESTCREKHKRYPPGARKKQKK